ncbi:putative terminase small subunit [Halorubrum tailed virus 25]|uniref:Terminase small subunit n=1 Tax=Halorubrum tailed virus 25 TaxID=2878006 RepID=A0AAE9BXJ5_9CAUD|nr:terminase small subunit [Halorubrum tailed virus 25]UBF22585.1 putative terminase small subunit [Halorubrum tailed virus 25]
MASRKVTGKTKTELRKKKAEFKKTNRGQLYDFEECFCLAKIPRQPEDYNGPDRYCVSRNLVHGKKRCKFHGGAGHGNPEYLDPLANMKHGMNAKRENLVKDFSDADKQLYEWVVEEWPEAYEVNIEDDPLAAYEFHALAVEIVRAERAEGFLIREGEDNQKKVFGPDGSVHYEDVPHYLADMLQRQRKLIMRMEDNLGISRKKRLQNETAKDATDVMKSFAEVGASLISEADAEYDPDEWGPGDDT